MPTRAALYLLAAASVLAACSSKSPHAGAPTTTTTAVPVSHPAPSTAPTTRPSTPPPPTVYRPSAAQPSPDDAAAALVNFWSTGNRAGAATLASPAAVAALFAQPYPAGYMQPRGCTDPSADPGTCTYANRQTGGLIQIGVTRFGSAWYANSVSVES